MIVRSSGVLCVSLVALCCVGCEIIGAPKDVSCDNLRRLAVGMTQKEVATLLGPPPRQMPTEAYRGDPPTDPITWDYSNKSMIDGGVRLHVRFVHGRLRTVDSYVRTLVRDLKDEGPRPTLFSLTEAGLRTEGAEFKRIYCPSSE